MIFQDLSLAHHSHDQLNFNHHSQIIGNYEISRQDDKNTIKDDIEGGYYTLPNDNQITDIEYKSSIISSIDNISDQVYGMVSHSNIIDTATSAIITFISLYATFRITIEIIKFMKKRASIKANMAKQFQRSEIRRATIMTAEQKAHIDKLQSFNQI